MRRGQWQRANPGHGRNSNPSDLTCSTLFLAPLGGKVDLEMWLRREQTGSGARYTDLGDLTLKTKSRQKPLSTLLTKTLDLWQSSPDAHALARKRAVSRSPRRTNSSADACERARCPLRPSH